MKHLRQLPLDHTEHQEEADSVSTGRHSAVGNEVSHLPT